VNKNWTELTRQGSLENWRELLAVLVTYAGPEEFSPLCGEWGVGSDGISCSYSVGNTSHLIEVTSSIGLRARIDGPFLLVVGMTFFHVAALIPVESLQMFVCVF